MATTINEVTSQYNVNLQKAASITGLGEQIIDISIRALDSVAAVSNENTTKNSAANQKSVLNNLYKSPILGDLIPTISGQQVVLTVSCFEVFMSDIVRCIGNDYRGFICWPNEEKAGSVELSLLNSEVATIGDLVLGIIEKRGISFQDLQSTKKFLADYLKIDFEMTKTEEEQMIMAAALRHAIVHAGAIADTRFIKQIRNTSYADTYKHGQKIEVKNEDAKKYMFTFRKAGRMINAKLNTKLGIVTKQK